MCNKNTSENYDLELRTYFSYNVFEFQLPCNSGGEEMLVTFRVALHYVCPDNYHVFMSCDVVELGLSSTELDSRLVDKGGGGGVGEGGSYFPYILLNEIQTMFPQLAKRSARVLPADLYTDHEHYVKIHR